MPFFPLHDNAPRILIERAWVTWGLIAACVLAYLMQGGSPEGERLFYGLGMIPATLTGEAQLTEDLYLVPPTATLVTSMFLHGGFMHLLGNMLYLWVFGDNVEDCMGHGRFLLFYLVCGVLAALAQVIAQPGSLVPTVGASGAISGVLGAYLMLHPKAKVLIPIWVIPIYVPAYILLVIWIAMQVFSAWSGGPTGGGVAWWAHIGGFIAGVILVVPFRYKAVPLFGGADYPSGLRLSQRFQTKRRK